MHFYGRAAAEAIFSGPIFRTFTAAATGWPTAWFRRGAKARRRVTVIGGVGASVRTDRHCIIDAFYKFTSPCCQYARRVRCRCDIVMAIFSCFAHFYAAQRPRRILAVSVLAFLRATQQ